MNHSKCALKPIFEITVSNQSLKKAINSARTNKPVIALLNDPTLPPFKEQVNLEAGLMTFDCTLWLWCVLRGPSTENEFRGPPMP